MKRESRRQWAKFPNGADYAAAARELLLRKGIRHQTWGYPSEAITGVLTGIPAGISTEKILADLRIQDVKALTVSQMFSPRDSKRPLDIYKVRQDLLPGHKVDLANGANRGAKKNSGASPKF